MGKCVVVIRALLFPIMAQSFFFFSPDQKNYQSWNLAGNWLFDPFLVLFWHSLLAVHFWFDPDQLHRLWFARTWRRRRRLDKSKSSRLRASLQWAWWLLRRLHRRLVRSKHQLIASAECSSLFRSRWSEIIIYDKSRSKTAERVERGTISDRELVALDQHSHRRREGHLLGLLTACTLHRIRVCIFGPAWQSRLSVLDNLAARAPASATSVRNIVLKRTLLNIFTQIFCKRIMKKGWEGYKWALELIPFHWTIFKAILKDYKNIYKYRNHKREWPEVWKRMDQWSLRADYP